MRRLPPQDPLRHPWAPWGKSPLRVLPSNPKPGVQCSLPFAGMTPAPRRVSLHCQEYWTPGLGLNGRTPSPSPWRGGFRVQLPPTGKLLTHSSPRLHSVILIGQLTVVWLSALNFLHDLFEYSAYENMKGSFLTQYILVQLRAWNAERGKGWAIEGKGWLEKKDPEGEEGVGIVAV